MTVTVYTVFVSRSNAQNARVRGPPPRRARARAVLIEKRESLANLVYFGRVGLELAAS